jgi:predicted enzyme related to lactoylglutathione lyase
MSCSCRTPAPVRSCSISVSQREMAGKNRIHLDFDVHDIESLASRLEKMGAKRLRSDAVTEQGSRWILMADPEGNEFCVCDGGMADQGR